MSYPPEETPGQPSAAPASPIPSQGYVGAGATAPLPVTPQGYPQQSYPQPGYPQQGYSQQGYPQAAAPVAKKSKAGLLFGILSLVLFLGLAGVTGLYFVSKSDADKTISDQKAQISTLTSDSAAKTEKLTKTEADLTAAQAEVTKSDACVAAVKAFFDAIKANDDAAGQKAVLTMSQSCEGSSIVP